MRIRTRLLQVTINHGVHPNTIAAVCQGNYTYMPISRTDPFTVLRTSTFTSGFGETSRRAAFAANWVVGVQTDPFGQGWPASLRLRKSYGRRASRSSPASESFGLACRAVARSIGTCEERCSARLRCATTRQPSLGAQWRAKAGGEGRNRTDG